MPFTKLESMKLNLEIYNVNRLRFCLGYFYINNKNIQSSWHCWKNFNILVRVMMSGDLPNHLKCVCVNIKNSPVLKDKVIYFEDKEIQIHKLQDNKLKCLYLTNFGMEKDNK